MAYWVLLQTALLISSWCGAAAVADGAALIAPSSNWASSSRSNTTDGSSFTSSGSDHHAGAWQQQQRMHGTQRARHGAPAARRLLQLVAGDDAGYAGLPPAAVDQWRNLSAPYARQYKPGSCFADYQGFLAKDLTGLLRLLRDPAATHIELRGDIVFSAELFPPDAAHDQSKGINITHEVEIRACTGRGAPIIVDVANILQHIYVYGRMTWQGSIRFVNSFPSPRRAGLFPLISILSIEGDGLVELRGVHIHGNEASALFDATDPFWEVYGNDPAFSPQPSSMVRLTPSALIMTNWTFNKTPFVLKSQGAHGVVLARGSSHWQFDDVLITWSLPPPSTAERRGGGLAGPSLALAVALPLVLGACLLAGAALMWCRCCQRRPVQLPTEAACPDGKHLCLDPLDASTPHKGKCDRSSGGTGGTGGTGGNSSAESGTGSSREEQSGASVTVTQELIEQARRTLRQTSGREASIHLEGLLGEGTFGKVYKGHWQGTQVAVKTMLLPAAMSGKERREKMAIMETAISASLSHPNIVQTYTYVVRPLSSELALKLAESSRNGCHRAPLDAFSAGSSDGASSLWDATAAGDQHGWEVRLVLELCDRGTLKDHLLCGGLLGPDGGPDMGTILATASDVAAAMLHLHTENIIHSDLKPRNVLLKSAGADARGFVAKVSDFGLSMRMDPSNTHVSNVYQGTLAYMAPEVLLRGAISRASDVYAFGILLWEMYSGVPAFRNIPQALLGHEVARAGLRPEFPPACPFEYQLLACRCWESDPAIRPAFEHILADVQRMAARLQQAGSNGPGPSPSPTPSCAALATPGATAAAPPALPPTSSNGCGTSGDGNNSVHISGPAGGAPGLPAAAAAAGAGLQPHNGLLAPGWDAAQLHGWVPRVSLLGSHSSLHELQQQQPQQDVQQPGPRPDQQQQQQQGQAAAPGIAVGADAAPPGGTAPGAQQQAALLPQLQQQGQGQGQQQALAQATMHGSTAAGAAAVAASPSLRASSLGTWGAASGGPWFGGSLAPDSMPSDLHLPMQEDPVGTAAWHKPGGIPVTAGAAAAPPATGQQQQQQGRGWQPDSPRQHQKRPQVSPLMQQWQLQQQLLQQLQQRA